MTWQEIVSKAWESRLQLLALITVVVYGRTLYREWLFNPVAGGNGKLQMDELAKLVILLFAWRALELEGVSEKQVYPDVFWFSIFFSIAAIAGIKHYVNSFKKSDSHSHSGTASGPSYRNGNINEGSETTDLS
jgi:hypothetical protein